ncbi:spore gernimation protein [Paenibacillus darwinianus]|uniref:Spore gernimation protein n=1 Tax=Paenibacillus darwinianus TaxID=1380763 RepID=A0A9W5S1W0_9BACL|nr:spore germination protein [Paenibacillus darwinianus]EXX88880.1 spore gernimation protein [Paenibacillus darwinianus]EXX89114.1 spore gernimation protein [Paenibacillus darwinianus]EXX90445.1 spore gernimation protein [Paenibacillus darwinianus]
MQEQSGFYVLGKKLRGRREKSGKSKLDERFEQRMRKLKPEPIPASLDSAVELLSSGVGASDDLIVRRFQLGGSGGRSAAILFIEGLTDSVVVEDFILRAAMAKSLSDTPAGCKSGDALFDYIRDAVLPVNQTNEGKDSAEAVGLMLSGDTAFLIDGVQRCLLLNTKSYPSRPVEEPRTESVVRGPRDGFTEQLRVNIGLIRRRLRDPNMRIRTLTVGARSQTSVSVVYIDDIAPKAIVDEVLSRIKKIDIDTALESGYIEQFIEDNHWTPFPLIHNTERPDKAVANLLEGRIVIITDGSPFALIAPALFTAFYQSPEDYYERFLISTMIRFIRIISMVMALLLPSLYIAFSSFHPEMIPSRLVIAMAAGRSTVPFPSVVEAFMMEITMEILREASVRLPGPIGPTIGIVGALVVGQAAVQAGIVSPIMVIIVALTTIGSFASPSYSAAIALRMLRFPMMVAAGMFGLYGIMLLILIIVVHLCSLKSFGVPYLAPLTPFRFRDLKDTVIRAPMIFMRSRPLALQPQDTYRMKKQGGMAKHDEADGQSDNRR